MNKPKTELTIPERRARRKRRLMRTLIVIAGILLIIRIAIPFVALKVIHNMVKDMPDYALTIEDIDVSLIGKTAVLKGLKMEKKNGKVPVPFFTCDRVKVHFKSIKKRATDITVGRFTVNVVRGKTAETSQMSLDPKWIELAKEIPFKPDGIIIRGGEVHYRELHKKPQVDLAMKEIRMKGKNLENLSGSKERLPSEVTFSALVEGATFKADAKFNQQDEKPQAFVTTSLSPMQLTTINTLLRSYTQFDIEKGTFSLYAQVALNNTRIKGYGKPVIRDLVIFEREKDQDKPFGKRVTEALIQAGANVFKKDKGEASDRISARVEVRGTIDNPKLNIWQVLFSALSNSYDQSLKTGLENQVRARQRE